MNFMQELIEEGNILTTPQHSEPGNDYPLIWKILYLFIFEQFLKVQKVWPKSTKK
jgi:hypothetical protein